MSTDKKLLKPIRKKSIDDNEKTKRSILYKQVIVLLGKGMTYEEIIEELLENEVDERLLGEVVTKAKREKLKRLGLAPDEYSLETRLFSGESKTLEVKKSFSGPDKIGETISAFCNSGNRATIFIGLEEKDKILEEETKLNKLIGNDFYLIGVNNLDINRQHLGNHLNQFIDGININDMKYRVLEAYGKKVFKIAIPRELTINRLVLYKGIAYKRVDNQNVRMTDHEIFIKSTGLKRYEPSCSFNIELDKKTMESITKVQEKLNKKFLERRLYDPKPHISILTKYLPWEKFPQFVKAIEEEFNGDKTWDLNFGKYSISDNEFYIFLNFDKKTEEKIFNLHKRALEVTTEFGSEGMASQKKSQFQFFPHISICKFNPKEINEAFKIIEKDIPKSMKVKKYQITREKFDDSGFGHFPVIKEMELNKGEK